MRFYHRGHRGTQRKSKKIFAADWRGLSADREGQNLSALYPALSLFFGIYLEGAKPQVRVEAA
jgi:hypothetical protein